MPRQRLFNRQNALKFAEYLYREQDGVIHYQPLCVGALATVEYQVIPQEGSSPVHYEVVSPKQTGRHVFCCVLGEMYEYFAGRPIYEGNVFQGGRSTFQVTTSYSRVVRHLSRLAQRQSGVSSNSIGDALGRLVLVNDAFCGQEDTGYVHRARYCAQRIRNVAWAYLI